MYHFKVITVFLEQIHEGTAIASDWQLFKLLGWKYFGSVGDLSKRKAGYLTAAVKTHNCWDIHGEKTSQQPRLWSSEEHALRDLCILLNIWQITLENTKSIDLTIWMFFKCFNFIGFITKNCLLYSTKKIQNIRL